MQRLVAILSDPGGVRDDEAIWDKWPSEILEAVILHVLYTAADADKTLLKVREMLADLDDAAEVMLKTPHRPGPDPQQQEQAAVAVLLRAGGWSPAARRCSAELADWLSKGRPPAPSRDNVRPR